MVAMHLKARTMEAMLPRARAMEVTSQLPKASEAMLPRVRAMVDSSPPPNHSATLNPLLEATNLMLVATLAVYLHGDRNK